VVLVTGWDRLGVLGIISTRSSLGRFSFRTLSFLYELQNVRFIGEVSVGGNITVVFL